MDFVREVLKSFLCNAETNEVKPIPVDDFKKFWTLFKSEDFELFFGDFAGFNIVDCIKLPET